MKKVLFLVLVIMLLSCNCDSGEINLEIDSQPNIQSQFLGTDEHAEAGWQIGTIIVTGSEEDDLTFGIKVESGLEIDGLSSEITLGKASILHYEDDHSNLFTVSVLSLMEMPLLRKPST